MTKGQRLKELMQDVFDIAAEGILDQGYPSMRGATCAYSGMNGAHCAIGFCLNDDFPGDVKAGVLGIDAGSLPFKYWRKDLRNRIPKGRHRTYWIIFIEHLQCVHDGAEPWDEVEEWSEETVKAWTGELLNLAVEYDLDPGILITWM